MHRKAYREFWSNTRFFIHLSAAEPRVTQYVRARHIINSLNMSDIAKITSMRRTGIAQGESDELAWVWSAGIWSEWTIEDKVAMKGNTEIWFPADKELPLRAAGYDWADGLNDRHWCYLDLNLESGESIQEMMRIIDKRGLSRDELIAVVRE